MAVGAKFTAITGVDEFARWLGAVVQEKVAKENAGLVEISVEGSKASVPALVRVKGSGAKHGFEVTVKPVRFQS